LMLSMLFEQRTSQQATKNRVCLVAYQKKVACLLTKLLPLPSCDLHWGYLLMRLTVQASW